MQSQRKLNSILARMSKKFRIANLAVLIASATLCSPNLAKSVSGVTDAKALDAKPGLMENAQLKAVSILRKMHLQNPIEGFDIARIKGSFYEKRGDTLHHAADFSAPRNTPIHAVANGQVAKLFESKAGGHTIYQYDSSEKYVFYYAHLEKYAKDLTDGQQIKRGEIIGYVGSSGNAPPGSPHLHLSVGVLTEAKTWWNTIDLDPYEILGSGK